MRFAGSVPNVNGRMERTIGNMDMSYDIVDMRAI